MSSTVSVVMDQAADLYPKINSAIARAEDLSSYRFVGEVELTLSVKDGVVKPQVVLEYDEKRPDALTQTSRTMFEIVFKNTLSSSALAAA